jgi:NADPH-dependent 2,4-dienoyl-CoA reductase/sulfur reductase-like enzyme/peroxiredoxin family protein/rhodanese-related sulfurtransferase/TusA-related sulfurtransferase
MKVVIIGGVAGGASTAARLRRLDEELEIVLLERNQDISYANCGLPYHIGKVIKDREQLIIVTKEDFVRQLNVKVKVQSEVVAINRDRKTVTVHDLANQHTYEEKYDKLVLAPGGQPTRPPLPGINNPRIFTLRNLTDMDTIINFIQASQPQRAAVVGAGFIGLEVAENLQKLGIQVSIVELSDQVMNQLDYEIATTVHQHLHSKNIELYLNDGVAEFVLAGTYLQLKLQSKRTLAVDFVILSIGVKPEITLATEANLTIGDYGGIRVSPTLQTNDPDIYALGDATEITDLVSAQPALIPLANSANKQGRLVADNIMGATKPYLGTTGTAIAKVFDLAIAITGNSEKQLQKRQQAYSKVYLHPSSHAGYYPDAHPLIMKVLYQEKTGKLLGAQLVGAEGVDKRIDVLATMIQQQKTVADLAALELAYAPPFSSAKDPVNLAGMIALNQMEGKNPSVFWDQVPALQKSGALFVDVRTKLEYDSGHLEQALHLPWPEIRTRYREIPADRKVVLYCSLGKRAYFALCILRNLGYKNVYNLNGGYKLYKLTTLPQENVGLFAGDYIDKRDEIHNLAEAPTAPVRTIDACGLQCPGPLLKLAQAISDLEPGQNIEITATDLGFRKDIEVWCQRTNHLLVTLKQQDCKTVALIRKGVQPPSQATTSSHDKTIVVFSNELDKALAAFVIANGAAAMGRQVTLFFTFWGLNVLRQAAKVKVQKGLLDKMFGFMMPRGSKKLSLSKMHMAGLGTALMKKVMQSKNIDSLATMIQTAQAAGVKLVACQMTMDMMGIKHEELLPGIEIGGVATYLGAAELADTNLFI